jgi:hypothetical protein
MSIDNFLDRYRYLRIVGTVGEETFGFDRYLNQVLYNSKEWKELRNKIIVRDNGYDMGHKDYPISGKVFVHHMNPISKQDILERSDLIFNPEYLISVSSITHNAIHYGNEDVYQRYAFAERAPNDTTPWR